MGTRRSRASRAWRSTVAAVKALPFVTAMSVRLRSEAPPAVTVAVSAPRPTTRTQGHGAVDGPGDAGPTLGRRLEEVPGAERDEDDVADLLAADLDRGDRHRRQRQAAQRRVVDLLGHPAERAPHPGEVLAGAGAGVDEEGERGAGHGGSPGRDAAATSGRCDKQEDRRCGP